MKTVSLKGTAFKDGRRLTCLMDNAHDVVEDGNAGTRDWNMHDKSIVGLEDVGKSNVTRTSAEK